MHNSIRLREGLDNGFMTGYEAFEGMLTDLALLSMRYCAFWYHGLLLCYTQQEERDSNQRILIEAGRWGNVQRAIGSQAITTWT